MRHPPTFPRLLCSLVLAAALAACGGGDDRSPDPSTPTTPTTPATPANVATAGQEARIAVQDAASPIAGATVVVPADAVAEGSVQIGIRHEDAPPGPLRAEALAEGAVFASKTIVLTKNRPGSFDTAVAVTMPYDAASLQAGDVPSVLYWDETAGDYQAVAVTAFDPTAGTVTFRTAHFSKYVVAAIRGLGAQVAGTSAPASAAALDADSGFRPSADAFFRANISSYSSPGGNCLGMAAYADWFFERARTPLNGGTGLFASYREGDPAAQADDVTAEELIVRAHAAASQEWGARLLARYSSLGAEATATSVIQAIKLTGKPQLFLMYGNPTWWERYLLGKASWGHALVAYRYSQADGVIYLYDPNLRGDDQAGIRYAPGQGFTGLTKTGLYPTEPDMFGFDSLNGIYSPADMRALFDGAAGGWNDGRFGRIDVTNMAVDPATRTAAIADRRNVRLAGTVTSSGGQAGNEPNTVDVYVAGSLVGSFPMQGRQFDVALPPLPEAPSTEVLMVARCHQCAPAGAVGARKTSIYGTFTRLRLKSGSALDNWGFEAGSFAFWDSVRTLWRGGMPVQPSDKSEVVGSGFDPIATSISTVLHGRFAARINNSDNGYHISRLTRDVAVPSDAASYSLAFNWAAVLEDPQHDDADQPYVDISVTHPGSGEVLYKRRYFANDPSFPGWKAFRNGQWKAIDWQAVRLDGLERFKGQTLRVVVEAADCALGAHGGYAYFDAEE